jgi:hypothetical protein
MVVSTAIAIGDARVLMLMSIADVRVIAAA